MNATKSKKVLTWIVEHLYRVVKVCMDYLAATVVIVLAADDVRARLGHKVVSQGTAFGIGLFLVALASMRLIDRVFDKRS